MTKSEFLSALARALAGLSWEDAEERLSFYSEMIEDRVEEGLSEAEAVAAAGAPAEIAAQILREFPRETVQTGKKHRMKGWEIALLILGSPLWLSLVIAAFAVVLSLYVSLWAAVLSLWAGFVSLIAAGFAVAVMGGGFALNGHGIAGAVMLGGGMVSLGLGIFLFFGCRAATVWTWKLPGMLARKMANRRKV